MKTTSNTPTYSEIHNAVVNIYDTMQEKHYDLVIGIVRGGLLPGVIFSNLLHTGFKTFEYSSRHGKGSATYINNIPTWISENRQPIKVLIVDDLTDSGHTMKEIVEIFSKNNFIVDTAVIYHKESSVFIPTYSFYQVPSDFGWIYFPWECHKK